jgi:hypothetical protein
MLRELEKLAAGVQLHELPHLYDWTCEWVFGMRTDQQTLEATFSRSDNSTKAHSHTHTHTHVHTLTYQV